MWHQWMSESSVLIKRFYGLSTYGCKQRPRVLLVFCLQGEGSEQVTGRLGEGGNRGSTAPQSGEGVDSLGSASGSRVAGEGGGEGGEGGEAG